MRLLPLLAGVLALSFGGSALAQPAPDLKAQCSSCHALEKPAAPSVERLWSRKGPDLWYAGAKFNRDWLVKWLQKPTTIRPGGVMWFNHAKPGEPRDTLDTASLPTHPAVEGGVTGPQLYDAGDRLQPDYVQAYMKDPQAFDRFVWMPRLGLSDPDLQRITAYITTLKAGK